MLAVFDLPLVPNHFQQALRPGLFGPKTGHFVGDFFGVTSLWLEEAGPKRLLEMVRDKWKIENGQHYRRDRTQDEDRCAVRETNSARLLSLFRSLAIFLHEQQRGQRAGKKSLPDFERRVCQQPGAMIRRFLSAPS